jgi:hypothetical protein
MGDKRSFQRTSQRVFDASLRCIQETHPEDATYALFAKLSGVSEYTVKRYARKDKLLIKWFDETAIIRLSTFCAAYNFDELAVWGTSRLTFLRSEAGNLAGIWEAEVRSDRRQYPMAFARLGKLEADMQDELCRRDATRAGALAFVCALSGLEYRAIHSNAPLEDLAAANEAALITAAWWR